MGAADAVRCMSLAVGLVIEVACRELPGGRAELADMLTGWQERHRGALARLTVPVRRARGVPAGRRSQLLAGMAGLNLTLVGAAVRPF